MFDEIDVITAVFPKNIQIILTKFGYSPIKFLHLILGTFIYAILPKSVTPLMVQSIIGAVLFIIFKVSRKTGIGITFKIISNSARVGERNWDSCTTD